MTRADQAGLRVEDLARSPLKKLALYRLDIQVRAALKPGKARRSAKKTRQAKAKT